MNQGHSIPNIDLNPHDWEEVKHILATYVPGYEVWAFGSRVTWTAKAYSDLDLAVITQEPLTLSEMARLKEAFDDSTISIKVDVVDWASTSESFRKVIESKRTLVQKAVSTKVGWKVEKLINCTCDGNLSYGIVQPGQNDPEGIPIVRVNNFKNGQLQIDDVLRVTPEIESKYKRTRLAGGEVLLTLVGSTGQSAVVPKELEGWNIARAVAVIRPKPEIGADWLNICLQSKEVQRFLDERANTTVQKTLNLADVREIPIPIPPIAVKKQIEAIAMAFTDKIELNRQINQTLEQIAQTIFKSWFVDFEPVKAKIEAKAAGRDPERAAMCAISGKLEPELDQLPPEHYQQLAATAALFPDALVESELGLIPVGWEVGTLADLCMLNAKSWGTKTIPPQVHYVDLANTKNGEISDVQIFSAEEAPSRARRVLRSGDTIIGTVRPGNRSFALIGSFGPVLTGSTGFAVLSPKTEKLRELVFMLATSDLNIDRLTRLADGAAYPAVRPEVVVEEQCIIPPDGLVKGFHLVAGLMFDQTLANRESFLTLATLRDTLLPKLLSGELTVGEVPREATA